LAGSQGTKTGEKDDTSRELTGTLRKITGGKMMADSCEIPKEIDNRYNLEFLRRLNPLPAKKKGKGRGG
jgi:hypothetical protein